MKLTLDSIGKFTWDFCRFFHIETSEGCFEWSDPEYGGDNTIRPCKRYGDWIHDKRIPFGRSKGTHTIEGYCGKDVVILEE